MHCVPARAYSEPDYFLDLTEMNDAEPGQALAHGWDKELHNSTGSGNKISHLLPLMETG